MNDKDILLFDSESLKQELLQYYYSYFTVNIKWFYRMESSFQILLFL